MVRVRRTLALVLAGALLGSVAAPRHAVAQDDDWSVKQNPFDPRIVERYKALLDQKLIDKARGYYKQYLDLDPKDVTARIELGDALAKHGLHQEALVELQTAAQQLTTDPARRVEVLARIGGELQALGKDDMAVAIYREAMDMTQKGHYLRKELTERIIEIYRKKQDLRGLIAYYEKT